MTSNYLKIVGPRIRLHEIIVFDDSSPTETASVFQRVKARAESIGGARVSIWRRPDHRGPWDQTALIGEPAR